GAVKAAENENDAEKVLEAAIAAGKAALADTINLNPVLKKAGVIDAGGKGYIYILDGMLRALRGEMIERL
ncbi:DAK2 domain-containing protein, partial [Klebsiella pneumoniae]|uniref:DAK2 domain-containing protein n=1 Tax=Klebsiella pneumoniae TaxID=573 RepID=UPI003A8B5A5F